MKLIMKLHDIDYDKENVIQIFRNAGVECDNFFRLIRGLDNVYYVRYEKPEDYHVWVYDHNDAEEAFQGFIDNEGYTELLYNIEYVGDI